VMLPWDCLRHPQLNKAAAKGPIATMRPFPF